MRAKRRFYSKITDGKTTCSGNIREALKEFEGKRVEITIQEEKKTRSLKQNSYYWGVVVNLVKGLFEEHGASLSEEEVHEYIKQEVLKIPQKRVDLPNSTYIFIPGTTTKLSKYQWEMEMEKIRAFFAEWGLTIPYPKKDI
jgi:hypothetical protein